MKTAGRTGSSMLLIILAIVIVGGGILFFYSKPFSTKVKEAARQATEWTSENIQKDPVGYLTWAMDECYATEEKLSASKLSMNTQLNQVKRKLSANKAEQAGYSTLLEEAKSVYKEAAASDSWPADLRGNMMSEPVLKSKIVEAHDQLANFMDLTAAYTKTVNVLGARLSDVEKKLLDVRKLRNKLATDLEVARVNESVENLTGLNDRLASIMDTTDALLSTSTDEVSLEDLIKPSGDKRVDEEFDKIMGTDGK